MQRTAIHGPCRRTICFHFNENKQVSNFNSGPVFVFLIHIKTYKFRPCLAVHTGGMTSYSELKMPKFQPAQTSSLSNQTSKISDNFIQKKVSQGFYGQLASHQKKSMFSVFPLELTDFDGFWASQPGPPNTDKNARLHLCRLRRDAGAAQAQQFPWTLARHELGQGLEKPLGTPRIFRNINGAKGTDEDWRYLP